MIRRHILIAAAAAMTVQPMTSLPRPVKQTGRDQVVRVAQRMASTGCAIDAQTVRVGVWNPPMVPWGNRRGGEQMRPRMGRAHDRCLPRRECFVDERPTRGGGVLDSPFRTPTFLGK